MLDTDHSQLYIINLYVFLRMSGLFLVNGRKTTRFPLICRKARTLELPNRDAGKKQRTGAYVKGARRAQSSARRSGRLPHRRTYLRRYRQGHSKCSVSRPQAGHGVSLTKTSGSSACAFACPSASEYERNVRSSTKAVTRPRCVSLFAFPTRFRHLQLPSSHCKLLWVPVLYIRSAGHNAAHLSFYSLSSPSDTVSSSAPSRVLPPQYGIYRT